MPERSLAACTFGGWPRAGLVSSQTPAADGHPPDAADPYIALLKRVRDALEAL